MKSTSPYYASAFGSTSISWLDIFDAGVENDKDDKADEVKEADDCWEYERNVEDDHRNGTHMKSEQNREVYIPSLLIPFLNRKIFTLEPVSYSSVSPYFFSSFFSLFGLSSPSASGAPPFSSS